MISSDKKYVLIKPEIKSVLSSEFNSCLAQLNTILDKNGLDKNLVIKQTIFIDAKDNEDYEKNKNKLVEHLNKFYNTILPPTSIIGQPPEDQYKCTIELILLDNKSNDAELKRKQVDGISYSVIKYSNTNEIHAGGLTSNFDSYDTLVCAQEALDGMEKVLYNEELTFADVVRQWNYIEGILDKKTDKDVVKQNYQIFNDLRSLYYKKAEFKKGYPAATGIGMKNGGIILEFIAVKNTENVSIIPIKNPRQIDAHRYSEEVLVGKPINGTSQKTSPKFERAKFTSIGNIGQIYVSGTAAILGQKTISQDDARSQTITTIENINELISESNISNYNICMNSHPIKLSYLRVYVKEENDIPAVREICEKYYPDIPALYLISDICRDDLLVELEGVACW